MEPTALRVSLSACRLCRSSAVRPLAAQWPQTCSSATASPRDFRRPQRRWASKKPSAKASAHAKSSSNISQTRRLATSTIPEFQEIHKLGDVVLKSKSIPTEDETLKALKAVESAAKVLTVTPSEIPNQRKVDPDPTSALLSLDARPTPDRPAASVETIDALSSLAYEIVKYPPVFISPQILSAYVNIQSLLERPSSLSEVFALYATKPTPSLAKNQKDIIYTPQNPRAIATAIPAGLANTALDTAILHRDLPLSLEIITNTFRAPSFKASKLFRKALPPAAAAALAPLAAYSIASQLSTIQAGLPPEDFTMFAFAGILTYGTAVGTIGYVALTTSNDQMERVTWAIGMPLWERWAREEERAACDRVAKAWGFKEKWRWGEEVGDDWDVLRDWLGFRGMILDKIGLMEGME